MRNSRLNRTASAPCARPTRGAARRPAARPAPARKTSRRLRATKSDDIGRAPCLAPAHGIIGRASIVDNLRIGAPHLSAGDKQALKWLGAIAAKLMQEDGDARTSPRSPE